MTIRQLFYRLVAGQLIPNNDASYRKIRRAIGVARVGGYLDWNLIEDRSRNLITNECWESPLDALEWLTDSYLISKWSTQPYYIEVWVEKDALIDILSTACKPLDVPFYACRGYNSETALYQAGKRLESQINNGKKVKVLHLGDHDPSGINMTDDMIRRVSLFSNNEIEVERIGLNMEQIRRYNLPPNDIKEKDPRSDEYIEFYGANSWELDALPSSVIVELVTSKVLEYRDNALWNKAVHKEFEDREKLKDIAWRLKNEQ